MKFIKYHSLHLRTAFLSILITGLLSGMCYAAPQKNTKDMLKEQQKAIDALTKKVNNLESSGGSQSLISNNVKFYGQINRGVLLTNDGDDSNVYHVDNDNSSTRVGLLFKKEMLKNTSIGGKMEFEFQVNASNEVNQRDTDLDDDHFRKRHIDIFVDSNKYGKLSVGHGSMASDNTSEADLSGTNGIGYSAVDAMAGGHFFYDSDSSALSGTTVKSVFNNMDGLGRKDRLRYDSPALSGVTVSASTERDGRDIAVAYAAKYSDLQIAAAAAFAHFSGSSVDNQFNTSVSALLSSGFNMTLALGNRSHDDSSRDNGKFIYLKAGYKNNFCKLGETAFAADIGAFNEISTNSDDGITTSIMAVQNIKKWSTELYCGYRLYSLDRSGADYDRINALLTGLKIKF